MRYHELDPSSSKNYVSTTAEESPLRVLEGQKYGRNIVWTIKVTAGKKIIDLLFGLCVLLYNSILIKWLWARTNSRLLFNTKLIDTKNWNLPPIGCMKPKVLSRRTWFYFILASSPANKKQYHWTAQYAKLCTSNF